MKKKALLMILGAAVLFTVVSFILALSGAVPLVDTLLPMNGDNYYFWQMVLSFPFVVAMWFGSGLLLRATAGGTKRGCGLGRSILEIGPGLALTLLAAIGPATIEAAFMAMGMEQPELVGYLSDPGPWQYLYFAFYILAISLAAGTTYRTARKALKAEPGRAVAATVLVTAFVAGAFVICIR